MRVIVTGGSGKAGVWTVRELAAHRHDVVNLDSKPPAVDLPGSLLMLDLTDAGQVYDAFVQIQPEGVVHLAANPSPSGFPRQQTFANNVLSTYNVMQAAGDSGGVARLVYASSEMATGWLTTDDLPPRFPFNEEDRVDTPNAYALSKYLGEIIADSMVARYPHLAICSLRINNVIPPDAYDILRYRRENFPAGGGNFWSYIDARDVGGAARAALEGESQGHEVFLIAAADTCLDTPIQAAVERLYGPGANFAPDHGPYQSAFDCRKIQRFFGWTAQHSWRDQE